MFEIIDSAPQEAVIKVIGVGGCGGNAVEHMIKKGVQGVEFIVANTDSQALKQSGARTQLQLGANLTRGLGAGARPEIGRDAALEDQDRIAEIIEGADMLFITAGMGAGTLSTRGSISLIRLGLNASLNIARICLCAGSSRPLSVGAGTQPFAANRSVAFWARSWVPAEALNGVFFELLGKVTVSVSTRRTSS